MLDCHPPAFMAAFPSLPLCPDAVSPAKDCAICVFKRGSLAVSIPMPAPITHQKANAFDLFYLVFFSKFTSLLPSWAEALMLVTAQTSTIASGGGWRLDRNKRRICKQSAKKKQRAGRENDSVGNSRNTSNFNI